MTKISNPIKAIFSALLITTLLSSCALSLPRFTKQSTGVTITNNNAQIEALKREDYQVLRKTKGKASSTRFYVLFFPIGKHKSNEELFENAYFDAVDNLPNADALILPRQKIKKFTIPLLLVNFSKSTVTVSGLGISVNGKLLDYQDSEIPYRVANNFYLKENANIGSLKGNKIKTQQEFDKYFENSSDGGPGIDFSTHYAIVVVGKESNRISSVDMNYLKFKGSKIELSYDYEKDEKLDNKERQILILAVDKKYQGDIVRK